MGILPSVPQNVAILLLVMAIVYSAISVIAQRVLSNPKRMREIQTKVKTVQKEMNDMLKSGASQQDLMKKQQEVMPLLGEQMKHSMKPMLVVVPLLLVIYYVIIPHIPIIASNNIGNSKLFFFIIVFACGIVSATIILIYDAMKGKKEAAAAKVAEGATNT